MFVTAVSVVTAPITAISGCAWHVPFPTGVPAVVTLPVPIVCERDLEVPMIATVPD
jgi:hypothetical protein